MTEFRFIILTLLLISLSACAPRLAELPQPPERLNQYGYSFMPLDEPGWKVGGRDGQHVMLGRQGASPDETIIIMAGNVAAPRFKSVSAFESYVRDQMHRDAGSSERFTVQKEELSMIRHGGTDCARVHLVSIDHQAKKRSGRDGDMVLEILELFCRHPDHDATVTVLGYSQRAYDDARDAQFTKKADRLLRSLEFSAF